MASKKFVGDSGNPNIDALHADYRWSGTTITYSYPADAGGYSYPISLREYADGFEQMPPEMRGAFAQVFDNYSQFINVKFVETTSETSDLRLAIANIDSGGRGYGPADGDFQSGDLYLPSSQLWNGANPGEREYYTLLHEVGHTLGLTHLGGSLDPAMFSVQFSIMSAQMYPGQAPPFFTLDLPTTPMLLDVAALQHLYGANYTTNSGNTVYSWSQQTGEMFIDGVGQGANPNNKIFMTLWDGGGNDTYDFSNYATNLSVDLRPGHWSTPSSAQRPALGFEGGFILAEGSIANAYLYNDDPRSLIENAIGGSGNDVLVGNAANNILTGNGGDDTFFYVDGEDRYFGGTKGANGDTADFSLAEAGIIVAPTQAFTTVVIGGRIIKIPIQPGTALADFAGGTYVVTHASNEKIATLTGIENITGSRFDDTIVGDGGNNILSGLDGNDQIDGGAGADTMIGGRGNDTYVVDNVGDVVDESTGGFFNTGIDTVYSTISFSLDNAKQVRGDVENLSLSGSSNINGTGNELNNVLIGNGGKNVLNGGAGNDTLEGGGGNDTLLGGTGNDRLDGGTGNDQLQGGADSDTYLFSGNFGNDTINDESGNADKIVISDLAQLQDAARIGNDLLLTLSTGTINIVNHFTTGRIESLQAGKTTVVLANGLVGGDLPGIIPGSSSSETLDGKGGDDLLYGYKGNDILLGGEGNDLLAGGKGRDTLDGGTGDDLLIGGSGADTFVFRIGYGHDTICDFRFGQDRLDISGFDHGPDISRTRNGWDLDFGNGDILTVNFDPHGMPHHFGQFLNWHQPKYGDSILSDC